MNFCDVARQSIRTPWTGNADRGQVVSEFDPALLASLLETRSRLQRLLSYAESGMKSSAISLIKEQLLNTESGNAGFIVGVMNSIQGTPLYVNLQDCLPALMNMSGYPAPRLFGKNGLYPDLPGHEQWQKSIAVLKGTITSLATLQPDAGSDALSATELRQEWCDVILWLKNRYCENDAGSLRIFRESEAAAAFPTLLNLDALWSLLETHGTIGQKRFGHFAIELPDTDTTMNSCILPTANDVREINPSIWSFAKKAVRPARTIIPATKEEAAWNVGRMLTDVLAWASYPDPHRLSLGWWDANKANADRVLNSAVLSFGDDECTLKKIHEIRNLTVRFLALLHHNPTLSTVPVQDWPVKAYQSQFDDLSAFEREFRIRGNAQPAAKNSQVVTDNSGSLVAIRAAVRPALPTVQPDAEGSGIPPVFTGPWKHLYTFLWQQAFDLSQPQDAYDTAFVMYRAEFGEKKIGSGKHKRSAYRMPSSSNTKTVRQGYRRQLKLHLARQ